MSCSSLSVYSWDPEASAYSPDARHSDDFKPLSVAASVPSRRSPLNTTPYLFLDDRSRTFYFD